MGKCRFGLLVGAGTIAQESGAICDCRIFLLHRLVRSMIEQVAPFYDTKMIKQKLEFEQQKKRGRKTGRNSLLADARIFWCLAAFGARIQWRLKTRRVFVKGRIGKPSAKVTRNKLASNE